MIERLKNFDLSGFKTILTAVLALISIFAGKYGFDLQIEDQTVIVTSIMSTLMVVLRIVTKTPVGISSKQ